MFSKKLILTALAAASLSACAFFEEKAGQEPNASWKPDIAYYAAGGDAATLATVAFSQGKFKEAEEHVADSLTINPKQPQALLVGALLFEQTGRINRAKAYYEDLILVGGDEMSLLGTTTGTPEKMTEIAKKRLRSLTLKQSSLVIEEEDGTKVFNISEEASQRKGKSAMEEALFAREQKLIAENRASKEADVKAVEVLFSDEEKNIISRFLIMKELAEKDLITKEEFLNARQTNIGGLLPLTNKPQAYGVDKPVPGADLIIERINGLKEAAEARAITPKEFSAERNLIVEAILPANPRVRVKPKAPAKDILSAAKELRKVEVIYDLNLITSKERDREKEAIERYLGLNKQYQKTEERRAEDLVVSKGSREIVIEEERTVIKKQPALIVPNVSDPFDEVK